VNSNCRDSLDVVKDRTRLAGLPGSWWAALDGPGRGDNSFAPAAPLPRRAFAIKILKLNPKSPRGGGGLFFGAVHPLLPAIASRAQKISVPDGLIFQSEIKRIQTQPRPLCSRRRGGGFHHRHIGRRKPAWRYSEIFFRRSNFRTARFGLKNERRQAAALKFKSNQQLAELPERQHWACRCSQADLFSEGLKGVHPAHPKNCREIRGGGYGR
jgi:hypothetical protein